MSCRWQAFATPREAAQACARHILNLLASKETTTMAVSGGSTPRLLFAELAGARFSWNRLHLFWVDERAVPPHDPQSNYRLARESFLDPVNFPKENVHRIHAELPPCEAAALYIEDIRRHFGGGIPQFDVIQLGMGADAHTASLFPGEPLIDDREHIAAAVYVEKMKQHRITLLPLPLLSAKHTAFLVAGDDKAPAVRAVFGEESDPKTYPAQLVAHDGREVAWYLDLPAASLLEE